MITRVVLVIKKTRLDDLILEHQTESTVAFLLQSSGASIEVYKEEDIAYKNALDQIRKQIPNELPLRTITRDELPNFMFGEKDLIVVCGPDGLFANVAKYVQNQLVLTVNPDPRNVAGVLMLFSPNQVGGIITSIQKGAHSVESLPFVKAAISDDKVLWGINDIFIGRKDQISARYVVSFNGRTEHQSSSGILVSTGIGSTGWMKSFQTMIDGIVGRRGGHKLSSLPASDDTELTFLVVAPFPSPNTGVSLVTDRIVPGQPLIVSSEMPTGGYIFSDGVTEEAIPWNAGYTVVVSVGDRYVQRIIR